MSVIGEMTLEAYEKLAKSNPRCLTFFKILRINPVSSSTALQLGASWTETNKLEDGSPAILSETLNEAWLLAEQFLGDKAAPGNLLGSLDTHFPTFAQCARAKKMGVQYFFCIGIDRRNRISK